MFACALKPSPRSSPAKAMHPSPVCTAARAVRVDDGDLAVAGLRIGRELGCERLLRMLPVGQPVEQPRAVGGLGDDWVATAPTPARAHGTIGPTANQCDWTATPSSPVRGVAGDDRIGAAAHACESTVAVRRPPDLTTDRARAVLDRARAVPAGHVAAYSDLRPGGAALRGHRAARRAPTSAVPWHRIVRADGSLTQGERQAKLLDAEGVALTGDPRRVDVRLARWWSDVDPA